VSALEWEHFQLLNGLRRIGFTCPDGTNFAPVSVDLKFDCRLWRASQLHSQDMANEGYFSHQSQDGRSPWARAAEQGIGANAENIAAGSATAQGTLEQWKGSNGHCKGMMNPLAKLIGLGHAYREGSQYRHYWTEMLSNTEVPIDDSCYPNTADFQGLALLRAQPEEQDIGDAPMVEPEVKIEKTMAPSQL